MESKVLEHIYLLVVVTLISIAQNAFFYSKVQKESNIHNSHTPMFERITCTNRNCMDTYPTFLAAMWCAGLCLSQAPAAFAGMVYIVARHQYFVGYMGQSCQSIPGFLFGKRILAFLVLMCTLGILDYLALCYFGSNYKEYIEPITKAASALLLLP